MVVKTNSSEVKVTGLRDPVNLYIPQQKQNTVLQNITVHPAVRAFATFEKSKNNSGIQMYLYAKDTGKHSELISTGDANLTFYLGRSNGTNVTDVENIQKISVLNLR